MPRLKTGPNLLAGISWAYGIVDLDVLVPAQFSPLTRLPHMHAAGSSSLALMMTRYELN
jgi:hypothetical protein